MGLACQVCRIRSAPATRLNPWHPCGQSTASGTTNCGTTSDRSHSGDAASWCYPPAGGYGAAAAAGGYEAAAGYPPGGYPPSAGGPGVRVTHMAMNWKKSITGGNRGIVLAALLGLVGGAVWAANANKAPTPTPTTTSSSASPTTSSASPTRTTPTPTPYQDHAHAYSDQDDGNANATCNDEATCGQSGDNRSSNKGRAANRRGSAVTDRTAGGAGAESLLQQGRNRN